MAIQAKRLLDKKVGVLARKYCTLSYYSELHSLLLNILPQERLQGLSKKELHKLFNNFLLKNYRGEEVLKYKLFEHYTTKSTIVAAFEIRVRRSRVDFLAVNGHTASFEIKSELDNFSKLKKQMLDYMLAFEYNHLVIDERHMDKAMDILPNCWGLWSFKNGTYFKHKKAQLNTRIESGVQLDLLTKSELCESFLEYDGNKRRIMANVEPTDINRHFKRALKRRYLSRWTFLTSHRKTILPIDVQFFFNNNILPSHIYRD